MYRAVALTVLFLTCLLTPTLDSLAADIDRSWKPLGQTKIAKKIKTAILFDPQLSLDENNRRLLEHRARTLTISATVPVQELQELNLVDHQARWRFQDQDFSGRVTAVMLSGDQRQATVFVEIIDSRLSKLQDQLSALKHQGRDAGLLSVEG